MSDEDIINVKTRILTVLSNLDDAELDAVEHWISSQSYKKELLKMRALEKTETYLRKIAAAIKKLVPFEAELPSESIALPSVGDQANCTKVNTCHIDEFLYDDEQVEQLVKKGKLKRQYCCDCNSRNIKDLIFVSHSMSINALHYIFKVLLPMDLDGKQLLDVGSRFGSVIFAAYHLTNASTIIGVEMNKECCEIQEHIKNSFSMDSNRIKILNSDITERKDIIQTSDIIIINVLDFFVDCKKHKSMWYFFKDNIKKGSYIIANRSMPETLQGLDIYEDFIQWLSICKPSQIENEILFDLEDFDNSTLYIYIVN